jgi:pimeloyl-ACP methyl ester carboxylesterase
MGGMTIMALARRRPDLFGTLVRGVFLLATSAGGLVESGLVGTWIRVVRALGLLKLWLWWLQVWAPLLERVRRRGTRPGRWFIRRYLFGRDDADPAMVTEVQELLERTPWPVTAAFYATFLDHNEEAALPALSRVPVTIVAAQYDRLTPARHAQRMAQLIGPGAQLIVVPGAGHSVNLTRPQVVNDAFVDLLSRVQREAGTAAA